MSAGGITALIQNFNGVKCVDKWELPADTYGPGGLISLGEDYKTPFLLYGPYFCTKNQVRSALLLLSFTFQSVRNTKVHQNRLGPNGRKLKTRLFLSVQCSWRESHPRRR